MKGLSGKRKLSFLGRGSNVAFVEIFIKPIYFKIGGEGEIFISLLLRF